MTELTVPDWVYEWELNILKMVPAYTLEMLDECDIDRLFPFYFANINHNEEKRTVKEDGIVYRFGKPYRKVKPQDSVGMKSL